MNFSERIKQIRQEKKISLQELADLSGVSKSMISKIEREEKNPTLEKLIFHLKALNFKSIKILNVEIDIDKFISEIEN